MTANDTSTIRYLQQGFLGNIRKGQDLVIDSIRICVNGVQSVTPEVLWDYVPYTKILPVTEKVVANAYDFAEELLRNQRWFAEAVLRAAEPTITASGPLPGPGGGGGDERPKPKPQPQPDPKPQSGSGESGLRS
jgi:hypothetical protein